MEREGGKEDVFLKNIRDSGASDYSDRCEIGERGGRERGERHKLFDSEFIPFLPLSQARLGGAMLKQSANNTVSRCK